MLRKISDEKGSVSEGISHLETELKALIAQRRELQTIVKAMHLEEFAEDKPS